MIPLSPHTRAKVPHVQCDLCDAPMELPEGCAAADEILGLLVCTQCVEDNLNATAVEPRAEVGMVGTGGGR